MPPRTSLRRFANCSRCKRENVPFYITRHVNTCVECHKIAVKASAARHRNYVRPRRELELAAFALFCKVELGCDDLSDQLAAFEWVRAPNHVRTRFLRAAKALEMKSTGT